MISHTNRGWWMSLRLAVTILAVFALPLHAAEDKNPPSGKPAEQPAADQPAAEPAKEKPKAEKADPFAVPNGTPEELLKYIDGLQDQRPQATDFDSLLAFRTKLGGAMLAAAEKILAGKSNDQQATDAVQAKMVALSMLDRLGDKDAAKKLNDLPDELEKAGRPKTLVREARGFLLRNRLAHTRQAGREEFEKLLADVKKFLSEAPVQPGDVELAMTAAYTAESANRTELAVDAYRTLGKILAESKDKQIASMGAKMEGAARRLTLVGKPLEIEGKTLDGKPFDWTKYKGKIVLVQFWATWCGPCLAEIDNIRKNYDAYHDRGFEVVGISLDGDRKRLEAFLKESPLPWTILFQDDPGAAEFDQPVAVRYGIIGIPTLFLTGGDGNVITLKPRGPQLGKQLEKLLGPTKKEEKKDDEKPKGTESEKGEKASSKQSPGKT